MMDATSNSQAAVESRHVTIPDIFVPEAARAMAVKAAAQIREVYKRSEDAMDPSGIRFGGIFLVPSPAEPNF
jgi:hypothetical protein